MTIKKHNPTSRRRRPPAFTLIEVLLAIGILAIGVVSVLSLFPVAIAQQKAAADDVLGTNYGLNVLAMLRAQGKFDNLTGGTGYTTTPTVMISGGGALATGGTAVVTTLLNGGVNRIDLTDSGHGFGGAGYTLTPTVAITGGGGSLATGTAIIRNGSIVKIIVNTNPYPVVAGSTSFTPVVMSNLPVDYEDPANPTYNYSIAYRRATVSDPVEVAIFVYRTPTTHYSHINALPPGDPSSNTLETPGSINLKSYTPTSCGLYVPGTTDGTTVFSPPFADSVLPPNTLGPSGYLSDITFPDQLMLLDDGTASPVSHSAVIRINNVTANIETTTPPGYASRRATAQLKNNPSFDGTVSTTSVIACDNVTSFTGHSFKTIAIVTGTIP